jgi:hypothetical protein
METIMIIVHLICSVCFYDLAEWGVPFGVDRATPDALGGWIGDNLHIYRIRRSGFKCDYDDHMYLVNAR